ncbi:MAG: hypothetical protein LBP56_03540 [Odoribacteraceae bacterium]|jgi:hypothetical protein|nr:hypothetical protein [Odoribacteraceae bacterium]
MKKIIFALLTLAAVACTKDDRPLQRQAIFLSPTVGATRATVNYAAVDYFAAEGYADATVEVKSFTGTFRANYRYATGTLSPLADTLWFPYDGLPLDTLTVWWPALEKRTPLPVDQSDRAIFLSADWLKVLLTNVPHAVNVPIALQHERSKFTFTLAGALAGTKIRSLMLGRYTAYCDPSPAINDAQLIFDHEHATDIFATGLVGDFTYEESGTSKWGVFSLKNLPSLQPVGTNYTIEIDIN